MLGEFLFHSLNELLFFLVIILVANVRAIAGDGSSYNVVNFGATGSGTTDDSAAFSKAWTAACGSTEKSPILLIPGKTFLLYPLTFNGPCKSSTISVQIDGNIVAPKMANWKGDASTWLVFNLVQGLIINGNGQLDGQGSDWWASCPKALTFNGCNNLQVSGLKHVNSALNHISVSNCNTALFFNLNISAPANSPNTDGFDIARSNSITILNTNIGTGDDCIAINTECSNINITGVSCGPGHGISIGSLGAANELAKVDGVYVTNCSFIGTQNGARIKTWKDGDGYARNIRFQDITLVGAGNPIVIDQFYCPNNICKDSVIII
ncbi:Probable polygalacturonase At3g15720 [Linum perenne]